MQVAGEVPYTFDQVMEGGGLFGALAITTEIGVINGLSTDVALGMASAALTFVAGVLMLCCPGDVCVRAGMPGVVRILTSMDIPSAGKNDIGVNAGQEKMFLEVGDTIGCYGQSVALVLADTFAHALAAAQAVVVNVTAKPAIITIQVSALKQDERLCICVCV